MLIQDFKEGDIITRTNVCYCPETEGTDDRFQGSRLQLVTHDEKSKTIVLEDLDYPEAAEVTLDYSMFLWNEGWDYYPETIK